MKSIIYGGAQDVRVEEKSSPGAAPEVFQGLLKGGNTIKMLFKM